MLVRLVDLVSFDTEGDSVVWRRAGGPRGAGIAVAGGLVYSWVGGELEVLDEATGGLVRMWGPPHDVVEDQRGMVLTDNLLFVGYSGAIHAIDLNTWDEVWHFPESGSISLSEGMLFVQADDGHLYAVSVGS